MDAALDEGAMMQQREQNRAERWVVVQRWLLEDAEQRDQVELSGLFVVQRAAA